jgi:hypothetical protein
MTTNKLNFPNALNFLYVRKLRSEYHDLVRTGAEHKEPRHLKKIFLFGP